MREHMLQQERLHLWIVVYRVCAICILNYLYYYMNCGYVYMGCACLLPCVIECGLWRVLDERT